MDIEFTKHALEQLEARKISIDIIKAIMDHPEQIVEQEGYSVYQSIINFEDGRFLVRVIINPTQNPLKVITVYRTSKINKYYEGEV